MKTGVYILSVIFILLIIPVHAQEQPGAPTGLLCELLRDPGHAVITDPLPEFGWIVNDIRRGARQTAYQILVASSELLINQDTGDMWDSGKTESGLSVNVEYGGIPLRSNTAYWWKVRTWDGDGKKSRYSQPQKFLTGQFGEKGRAWPSESDWIELPDSEWVLENRQRSSYHEIKPQEIKRLEDGHYFVDFGRAAFATLRLNLNSETAGDSVVIYLGERRQGNAVHKKPGVSNIGFKKTGLEIKKGQHTYTIDLPRFISHYPNSQVLSRHMPEVTPFRYVEIVNCPSGITVDNIRQLALFYYFDDEASQFTSSDRKLNQVWELCKYTLKATPFLALYADGNRERMPYEADAYIQQLGHYSVDREFSVARYTGQFLIFNPAWPTEWHMHAVFMAWADYQATGDKENLLRFYEQLKAKTLLALAREDGLISTRTGRVTPDFLQSIHFTGKNFRDIVDWPPGTPRGKRQAHHAGPTPEGERDGYVFRPINTVVNSFHYRALILMAKIAQITGRGEDSLFFAGRAQQVKERINSLLFDQNRGIYVDGDGTEHASLHANMFPLAFGLVAPEYVPSVVGFIKSRGMACSVYGAQYLLEALFSAGESAYALELMTSESKRSWMNMIRAGSSMTTEAWDEYFKPNLTWNHAWGSAPANIITRKLMGIEPLEPGFELVRIKPQPANLEFVKLKVPTIRGAITCDWRQKNNHFEFNVTVPANTRARIWLPVDSVNRVKEAGKTINKIKDIRFVEQKNAYVICETGPGQFCFTGSR